MPMTIMTTMMLVMTQREEAALRPPTQPSPIAVHCQSANGGEMTQQSTCKRIRRTTLGPQRERTMASGQMRRSRKRGNQRKR
jgi:hypothetical protein